MCAHLEPVQGAPCWVSLATNELETSQDFYAKVLGWSFRSGQLGSGFSVAYSGDVPVAGFGAMARSLSIPVEWLPYFSTPDVDVAASRVKERAATVAVGPLRLGDGRAIMAADPAGARFGLWQSAVYSSWQADDQRPPGRLDLRTRDAFAAAIFYAPVLGWAQGPGSCEVTYEGDAVQIRAGEHLVATLWGGAVEAAPDPQIRPRWEVSFYADDMDAAAGAAEAAGGTVISCAVGAATDAALTLRDPDGALFTVRPRPRA